MKHPVKAAALLALALALCLVFPVSAESSNGYLGQPLPDFTVTTLDGGVFTLSQVLKEKDMVLINLWATWCGPCDMEFPYLEEAYEQYRDRVEVIALSVEPDDTPDMLAAYAKERGLTFPIGSDTETGLGYIFATEGIPTSVAVDRFGNVALVEVGAQITAEPFANLFDLMTGEEYTETRVLDGFPKSRPTVEAGAEGQLAAAAGMDFYVASSDDDMPGLSWRAKRTAKAASIPPTPGRMIPRPRWMWSQKPWKATCFPSASRYPPKQATTSPQSA